MVCASRMCEEHNACQDVTWHRHCMSHGAKSKDHAMSALARMLHAGTVCAFVHVRMGAPGGARGFILVHGTS
jgi:hypothetical protein